MNTAASLATQWRCLEVGTAEVLRPSGAHGFCGDSEESLHSMLEAYRASGGVLTCAEVLRELRATCSQPISVFARWTIRREIVYFTVNSTQLVPAFQFEPRSVVLRPFVRSILGELAPAFDELEVAHWFVQPNTCLPAAAAPVHYIAIDPGAVFEAARADRFIAAG